VPDSIKDHLGIITAGAGYLGSILLGIFGLGKLMQRVTILEEIKIKEAKDIPMTQSMCLISQGSCAKIQCLKHTQYDKNFIILTERIDTIHAESSQYYKDIMQTLVNMNNNGKNNV
jgi:hypothetical protein